MTSMNTKTKMNEKDPRTNNKVTERWSFSNVTLLSETTFPPSGINLSIHLHTFLLLLILVLTFTLIIDLEMWPCLFCSVGRIGVPRQDFGTDFNGKTCFSGRILTKRAFFFMDFDEKHVFLDGFWRKARFLDGFWWKTSLSSRILTKNTFFWTDVDEKHVFLYGF